MGVPSSSLGVQAMGTGVSKTVQVILMPTKVCLRRRLPRTLEVRGKNVLGF